MTKMNNWLFIIVLFLNPKILLKVLQFNFSTTYNQSLNSFLRISEICLTFIFQIFEMHHPASWCINVNITTVSHFFFIRWFVNLSYWSLNVVFLFILENLLWNMLLIRLIFRRLFFKLLFKTLLFRRLLFIRVFIRRFFLLLLFMNRFILFFFWWWVRRRFLKL